MLGYRPTPIDVTGWGRCLSGGGDTEGLVAILAPLARMLKAGPKVALEAGRTQLPPLLIQLLKRPPAMAALPLLEALRAIYQHHPRPKVAPTAVEKLSVHRSLLLPMPFQ